MSRTRVPLFDTTEDQTLRIQTALACQIGFNEAVILMQLEYLISLAGHQIDGKVWTYQSLTDLQAHFPWWSLATISRGLRSLEIQDLIFIDNFNKRKQDRTQWFALNFDKIEALGCVKLNRKHNIFHFEKCKEEEDSAEDKPEPEPSTILQNENCILQNETTIFQNETTLPEITTEKNPNGVGEKSPEEQKDNKQRDGPKTILAKEFTALTGIKFPVNDKPAEKFWWSKLSVILREAGNNADDGKKLMREAVDRLGVENVYDPNSLVKTIRKIVAEKNHKPKVSFR